MKKRNALILTTIAMIAVVIASAIPAFAAKSQDVIARSNGFRHLGSRYGDGLTADVRL